MTEQKPAVTIVIPAYNIARYIGPCLHSVLAQTETSWEAIVVDDGSTDDTATAARAIDDPRIKVVTKPNAGVSAARNLGLSRASGDAVMFLDGDDLLHPQALARLSHKLTMSPTCVAAFGTFRKILDNGEPYPGQKDLSKNIYPEGDVLADMLRENFFANGGHVLVRAETAKALGGFNTSLRLSEDWEFWCRLAAAGPFAYLGAEPEVFYLRMRPGSSSGSMASHWDKHQASIQAVLANADLARHFTPQAWKGLSKKITASHMWEAGRVNFTHRQFSTARRLMIGALIKDPTPKRLAMFGLAQISQILNKSLVSRLRFHDHDQALQN